MKAMKKTVAVIVMVLSALLLVAMLAGIVGAWWGQGQLRGVVSEVSATLDRGLERTQGAMGQVSALLANTQGRVDGVVAQVNNAGTTIEETNLVLAVAERLLDQDLTPAVERITDRVTDVRDTIGVIENSIRLMRRLPGGRDNELLTQADKLISEIKGLAQLVQDVRTTVQTTKSQATAEAVRRLTTPLDRVSQALAGANADVAGLNARIDSERAQLAAFTRRVLLGITLGAIVITVALLWMALAQLGLFLHAYGAFTGRDPLPGWHKGNKGDEAAPSLQAPGGVA